MAWRIVKQPEEGLYARFSDVVDDFTHLDMLREEAVVRHGVTVPKGFLPVFGCDTEEQAKMLLVATCGTNLKGEFIARELVEEQTIENLSAFSDRLEHIWDKVAPKYGWPSVEELSRRMR